MSLRLGFAALVLLSKVLMFSAGGWWLVLAVVSTLTVTPLMFAKMFVHPWEKKRQ